MEEGGETVYRSSQSRIKTGGLGRRIKNLKPGLINNGAFCMYNSGTVL